MVQRIFFPSDEWLYFKIYTGPIYAENILLEIGDKIILNPMYKSAINSWHFVRYNDPDFHIRIRFQIKNNVYRWNLFSDVQRLLDKYKDTYIVWKLDVSTYSREIERYGEDCIELIEKAFEIDSICIIKSLKILINKETRLSRWAFGCILIDDTLNSLGLDLKHKMFILEKMSNGFLREFGYDDASCVTLNRKYRERSNLIKNLFLNRNLVYIHDGQNYENIISENLKDRYDQLKQLFVKFANLDDSSLSAITSFIHMSMNRLFCRDNRMYELVLYHHMHKYYTTALHTSN